MVQLSHPYMTTGKTIALTRQTFAGKVMFLLFNMLSRLVRDQTHAPCIPALGVWSFLTTGPLGKSHELKRLLLLGTKAMTNLDSVLKSRDITLPTKVFLVKAMIFPIVMYGCESWTIKKAEH